MRKVWGETGRSRLLSFLHLAQLFFPPAFQFGGYQAIFWIYHLVLPFGEFRFVPGTFDPFFPVFDQACALGLLFVEQGF